VQTQASFAVTQKKIPQPHHSGIAVQKYIKIFQYKQKYAKLFTRKYSYTNSAIKHLVYQGMTVH
jgi:hypothetical protein